MERHHLFFLISCECECKDCMLTASDQLSQQNKCILLNNVWIRATKTNRSTKKKTHHTIENRIRYSITDEKLLCEKGIFNFLCCCFCYPLKSINHIEYNMYTIYAAPQTFLIFCCSSALLEFFVLSMSVMLPNTPNCTQILKRRNSSAEFLLYAFLCLSFVGIRLLFFQQADFSFRFLLLFSFQICRYVFFNGASGKNYLSFCCSAMDSTESLKSLFLRFIIPKLIN